MRMHKTGSCRRSMNDAFVKQIVMSNAEMFVYAKKYPFAINTYSKILTAVPPFSTHPPILVLRSLYLPLRQLRPWPFSS